MGWEILLNPDEEIGSPSSAPLFEEAAKRHHVGLLFEPSFPDGAFVSERKGSATYSVIVKGRAAHVGRDFLAGRHAIYALSRFIREVEKLNQPAKDLVVSVGYIEGGGPVNIVPDLAICRLNTRTSHPHKLSSMQEKLEKIASHCQEEGLYFSMIKEAERFPKPFDDAVRSLFDLYADCANQLDIPFALRETGVCDGNILSHAGLPTLDSLGAVGGQIHTPEEYLLLPSLVERAQLAALFLLRLATRDLVLSPTANF